MEAEARVSIDTALPESDPQVSVDTATPGQVPLSPDLAEKRAQKAVIGLPNFQSYEGTYNSFLQGQEGRLREMASGFADYRKNLYKNQALATIVAEQGAANVRPDDIDRFNKLFEQKGLTDPKSVFEEYFSTEYIDHLRKAGAGNKDSWWNQEPPVSQQAAISKGRAWMSLQEVIRTKIEDGDQALSSQNLFGRAADRAKELLVPFYWQTKQRGGVVSPLSGVLLGENIQRQSDEYFRMPFTEGKKRFLADFDAMAKDNPGLAVDWAKGILGQSSNDRAMNNIFSTLDLPAIGTAFGIGKGVVKAVRTETALKSMIRAAEKEPLSKSSMLEAAGDIKEAGVVQAAKDLLARLSPEGPVSQVARLDPSIIEASTNLLNRLAGSSNTTMNSLAPLPKMYTGRANDIAENSTGLRQAFVNQLVESYESTGTKVWNAIERAVKVDRLPALFSSENALRTAAEDMKNEFPGIKNAVMQTYIETDRLGIHHVNALVGRSAGEVFSKVSNAEAFIKEKLLKNATIEPKGVGFVVKLTKPLPETSLVIRDGLHPTGQTKTQTPDSMLNAFGGYLGSARTPEETLSVYQRMMRKTATYGTSNLQKVAKEIAAEIDALKGWNLPFTKKREMWKEWQRVVDESRTAFKDPLTGRPVYAPHPDALNNFYQNTIGRLPSEPEIAAYFSHKRLEETHDIIHNVNMLRSDSRRGAQKHTIYFADPSVGTKTSNPIFKKEIDGMTLREYPKEEDSAIWIKGGAKDAEGKPVTADISKVRVATTTDMGRGKTGDALKQGVLEGRIKAIEVLHPEDKELQFLHPSIGDARIKYIFTEGQLDSGPLSWERYKGRPLQADYEHYVRQGIVNQDPVSKLHWYEGDRTMGAFGIRAMAKDVAEKIDNVRILLKDQKEDLARILWESYKMPQDWKEVRGWFLGNVSDSGLPIKPTLNLTERVQAVPRNKMTIEMDKEMERRLGEGNIRDGARGGYGRYLNDKYDFDDIFTYANSGTKGNPLYSLSDVRYIDPITSINRALNRVINDAFMNDYKIFSVEHWIQEAKDLLKISDKQLADAPFYYFHNPRWKEGQDPMRIANLMTANFQIKQFIGVQDATQTWLHSAAQKLADSVYERFGPKYALVPSHLLPYVRDPFSFMRSVAFDASIGLFAIPQLWVQLQTYNNILGVAGPGFAVPGAKAALLHTYTRMNKNPEILDHMDALASKKLIPGTKSFRPGEFKEASEALDRTGYANVAGEHALRDNPWVYDIISDNTNSFLNAGRFFFREGERGVRVASWYTAYLEHRAVNPTGRLAEADIRAILDRADLLSVNMSRASSSAIHKGIFSVPTQFLTYQLRTAELFLGKRLTEVERARLFGTYAAMYGLPTAFGLSGLPVGDYIKKWALEDGYVVGDNYLNTAITEGLPSLIAGLTTGKYYNVGERYGVQGFEPLREALRSDKTVLSILGGASGTKLAGFISNMDGYWSLVSSAFRDDDKAFKMHVEDFVAPFKEISTVNSTWKLIAALNTGRWVSKKEAYLDDVSKGNAIFSYLSGLSPQSVSDLNTMTWARKDEKDLQAATLEKFKTEWRRGLTAMNDGNPTQASEYFKNGFTWLKLGGYPTEDYNKAIAIANENHESMVNQIKWDFFNKKVPATRKSVAQDQQRRAYQLGNK